MNLFSRRGFIGTLGAIISSISLLKTKEVDLDNPNNYPVVKFDDDGEITNWDELLKHRIKIDTLEKYNEYLKLRGYQEIGMEAWKYWAKQPEYINVIISANDTIHNTFGVFYGHAILHICWSDPNWVLFEETINSKQRHTIWFMHKKPNQWKVRNALHKVSTTLILIINMVTYFYSSDIVVTSIIT